MEQGGAWRYPLPDALGSVRQWTDPAGAVLGVQSYGPYGEPRGPVGTPPWGFTGEWQDPAGMVYLRARWYNPYLNRFTQPDTVALDLGDPQSINPFTYARNNPTRYTDPTGHYIFEETPDEGPIWVRRRPTPSAAPAIEIEWLDDSFRITHYTFALESDPIYANDSKVPAPGLEECYREGFLYSNTGIRMQGTGLAEDGRYITINWQESDLDQGKVVFVYGIGGRWGTPEPWKTVATGDPRLEPGARIVIEAYPGRVFVVNDSGSGVGARHIDVFIGAVTIEEAFGVYGTKRSRVGIVK